jgi:hypothetical protein
MAKPMTARAFVQAVDTIARECGLRVIRQRGQVTLPLRLVSIKGRKQKRILNGSGATQTFADTTPVKPEECRTATAENREGWPASASL